MSKSKQPGGLDFRRGATVAAFVALVVITVISVGYAAYLTANPRQVYLTATQYVTQQQNITMPASSSRITVSTILPSGWKLDNLVSGGSVKGSSCGLNSMFTHSANAAIVVIVYSTMNLPSNVEYTPEMNLGMVASYNAIGSTSPAQQPSVAIYAGTANTANTAGNFNALFGSTQETCLIIAMSWLFHDHSAFTFNNYAIGGSPWQGTASLQTTMGADSSGDANRLCLFFASIYGQGGQPTATNGSGLSVLQTIGNYQISPNISISTQVAYVVSASSQTETMSSNTLDANGILYPFIAIDPA